VVFIEARHEAVKLIRQNLQICGAASGYRILENDVFTALRTLARENFSAGIAFLDPPYNWGPYRDLIEILFRSGIARSDSLVVVEHHRKTDLPESGDGYRCTRAVRQSDKVLSFFSAGPRPGDTLIHQVF
jgi:16S rRNA (guanine966-N2)-methyltransferase